MAFQDREGIINWKVHFSSSIDKVFWTEETKENGIRITIIICE